MKFNVTYAIVTPESAERGDCAEQGFALEDAGLRDAIDSLFKTRTSRVDGIAFGEADYGSARIGNGMEFETGANETRTLHMPQRVTDSSRGRILRLIGNRAGFPLTLGWRI